MAATSAKTAAVQSIPVSYSGKANTLEKLQVGSYGTEGNESDWTYYDRMAISSAVNQVRMFTEHLGVGGKTWADTNMTIGGQIPQAQLMDVRAIKVMYSGALKAGPVTKDELDLQSLYELFDETTVALKLANKDNTFIYTLQELMGSALQFVVTPSTAGDNISQPQPRFHGIFPLNKRIILAALTPFEVQVTHHAFPSANLDGDHLRIGLAGFLTRAT